MKEVVLGCRLRHRKQDREGQKQSKVLLRRNGCQVPRPGQWRRGLFCFGGERALQLCLTCARFLSRVARGRPGPWEAGPRGGAQNSFTK